MRTVHEVSKSAGVSVRTLHHYDAIGLLKPTAVTDAGYRLYDDAALARLQMILLFRELQFPLKEIKAILECPDFERAAALKQQIHLLELQRKRLGEMIVLARDLLTKGVNTMDFSAFDRAELEQYAAEVKARWSVTTAYKEFAQKTAAQTVEERNADADGLMALFAELGKVKHLSPDSPKARALVEQLRKFITDHYYTCTPQILRGLGQMYIVDERFQSSIDRAGGPGTADFANRAITAYCNSMK